MIDTLSLEHDERINGYCVTARATYDWFLQKTRGSEANLKIQRQIIRGTKAYATLRADLKRGCVLPPLVLSAQNVELPAQLNEDNLQISEENERDILSAFSGNLETISSDDIQIIDGLQRTNAIRQTSEELEDQIRTDFLSRKVRFEMWINLPFNSIAYRMLLLNAGQKPMSLKHQVEILSMKLSEDLSTIEDLEVLIGPDRRRSRPGQFQLARLSQAFQAWLQGTPNIDVSNAVMQELLADSALETLGASLKGERPRHEKDSFKRFIEWMVKADHRIVEANQGSNEHLQFFGADTVTQGLAAVVGYVERNESLSTALWPSLEKLLGLLESNPENDPLGINEFNNIRSGFNPGRRNVGVATRDLVFDSFRQYFMGRGDTPMNDCWVFAGSLSKA